MDTERDYKQEAEDRSRNLMKAFGNAVNSSNFDKEAFIDQFTREHRTLQQNMFREILGLICFMTKDDFLTDGRNEQSKKMAKKFIAGYAQIIKEEEIERLKMDGYSPAQAEAKSEEYRKAVLENPQLYMGLSHI